MRTRRTLPAALLAFALLAAAPAAAQVPKPMTLGSGWEWRSERAAPAPEQGPPPIETEPEAPTPPAAGAAWTASSGRASQVSDWQPATVPSVFDSRLLPSLFGGTVRSYRMSFTPPATPKGFGWRFVFDEVRRKATVFLNGRRIGGNDDPYTPFSIDARGLKPGVPNLLRVLVDSRKNPRLPEAWWNWGGIVRPVHLVPVGRAHIRDLGTMSQVECSGPATGCKASLLIDGVLEHQGTKPTKPALDVRLRAPGGRTTTKRFKLPSQSAAKQPLRVSVPVPAPELWAPDTPRLYAASITLRDGGAVQQVEHRQVGLRSVTVRGGKLMLNNRAIQLRGASIHEDMPGDGAALTPHDMDTIVAQLKELGANVTRAHYLLNDALLARFDRAGIMVWNEAPIWQRDRHANVLRLPKNQQRAWETVRRTVIGGRSHPSVITHSVANELWSRPDQRPKITKRYLLTAQEEARKLDPTLPISVDINGRPGHPEQFTYHAFDMIGINQYYGWYRWVSNFDELPLFLQEMRDNYPDKALVMTEWGAEGRQEWADEPITKKGSYAFQAMHAARTLDVLDQAPLSGGIYWTLREFGINPGWTGGAGKRIAPYWPNTMHQKGLLTYDGVKKPVWQIVHDRYATVPLYEPTPAPATRAKASAAGVNASAAGARIKASAVEASDVTRVERAVLALHDDKADAAGAKAANEKAARKALAACDERGPGWDLIRAVGDRSQRNLYARGARTLWRDLGLAAADAAALKAYQSSFDRFLERFDPPLSDSVLQAGVDAIRSRLAYEAAASASATCKTFEKVTSGVREFKHGVPADFLSGQIYQRMIKFLPKQRSAAARKHWTGARVAAADAARARLVELGGDVGRATYFRFAYSLDA